MARLIDADRLLRDPYFQEDRYPCSHLIRMAVGEQRTVDAVPVVHGRWKPNFEYDFDRGEHRLTGYHCDQCGIWTLKKSNYCPNCGADMRERRDGE